jgi:hypothetical protein
VKKAGPSLRSGPANRLASLGGCWTDRIGLKSRRVHFDRITGFRPSKTYYADP